MKKIIRLFLPPLFLTIYYNYIKKTTPVRKLKILLTKNKIKNKAQNFNTYPCHYHTLFIKNTGEILPCCAIRDRKDMVIAHLTDTGILAKIKKFYRVCMCPSHILRKGKKHEKVAISHINIELGLNCQANCAMCCVDAPAKKTGFNYYPELINFINEVAPRRILVQGGEILVQKKALTFLANIKKAHKNITIDLVTNANVDPDMITYVEEVFDTVFISFVGFQKETYQTVMGLDISKTIHFTKQLLTNKKVAVVLKYLTTPLNIHEAGLFLEWAVSVSPYKIVFSDAGSLTYINEDTPDNYWHKITTRTASSFKKTLISNKQKIIDHNILLGISLENRELFEINDDFIKTHHFEKHITWNY